MGRAAAFVAPDLSGILERAKSEYKWTGRNDATEAELWYDRFLQLVWDNPGGVTYMVGDKADQLWHTHISFTTRYRAYCLAIFGFVLDHTPTPNAPPLTAAETAAAIAAYATKGWGPIQPDMIVPCH